MNADERRENQALLGNKTKNSSLVKALPKKDSVLLGVHPPFSAVKKSFKTLKPPMNADKRRENQALLGNKTKNSSLVKALPKKDSVLLGVHPLFSAVTKKN